MVEFREWPKIARLNRDMIVTEKIDGTNACVIIYPEPPGGDPDAVATIPLDGGWLCVAAQSRSRIITPAMDNHGFAKWVQDNAAALVVDLGPGYHFGEWAGAGIGKRYPGTPKTFWLFNAKRWRDTFFATNEMTVVPIMHEGPFSTEVIAWHVQSLRETGSWAYQGAKAEGVVAYHVQGNTSFKVTLDKDDEWKGKSA